MSEEGQEETEDLSSDDMKEEKDREMEEPPSTPSQTDQPMLNCINVIMILTNLQNTIISNDISIEQADIMKRVEQFMTRGLNKMTIVFICSTELKINSKTIWPKKGNSTPNEDGGR